MTRPGPLAFYLDFISSNAYLAWVALLPMAERFGRPVEVVPVLFAGLLEAHGQLGPAEVRPKARWMSRNNLRKAAGMGITLRPPRFHPFNPLLPLRVCSLPMDEAGRRRLVTGLFEAVWSRQLHASEPEVVAAVADEAGLDGKALVAAAGAAEAKQALRRQTEDAIAAGVFGVPTVIVDGELFWGFDDFPWLERFLAGDDPLDAEALREWEGPPRPGAMRRKHRERPPLRLAHANLPARDPEALARWWAETFHLEQRGAFVVGPGTLVAFERDNMHVGFAVPTRDEALAWARKLGVEPEIEPRYVGFKVRDPEGHVIEVYWEP
jgi:2-hydroxychromene-2-carboxylate isomerase